MHLAPAAPTIRPCQTMGCCHQLANSDEAAGPPGIPPPIPGKACAAETGANIFKLAETSRHRSLDTLRDYVRRVDLFKEAQ